jgi:hypothetical protein
MWIYRQRTFSLSLSLSLFSSLPFSFNVISLYVSGRTYKEKKEEKSMNKKEETKLTLPCHYSSMTNKLTISRRSFLKNDKEENFFQ